MCGLGRWWRGCVGMGSRRLASLREVRDGVCFLGWMQVFKWSE
jgi:hypothetical protein